MENRVQINQTAYRVFLNSVKEMLAPFFGGIFFKSVSGFISIAIIRRIKYIYPLGTVVLYDKFGRNFYPHQFVLFGRVTENQILGCTDLGNLMLPGQILPDYSFYRFGRKHGPYNRFFGEDTVLHAPFCIQPVYVFFPVSCQDKVIVFFRIDEPGITDTEQKTVAVWDSDDEPLVRTFNSYILFNRTVA